MITTRTMMKQCGISVNNSKKYHLYREISRLPRDLRCRLPNKFRGHFATPLEYVILLIC